MLRIFAKIFIRYHGDIGGCGVAAGLKSEGESTRFTLRPKRRLVHCCIRRDVREGRELKHSDGVRDNEKKIIEKKIYEESLSDCIASQRAKDERNETRTKQGVRQLGHYFFFFFFLVYSPHRLFVYRRWLAYYHN